MKRSKQKRQRLYALGLLWLASAPLCGPAYSQIARWDTIRSEQQYLAVLARSDLLSFKLDFEYPFLALLNEEQKQHYLEMASLGDRKSFIRLYWRTSNPNPLMEEYEWLEEFIRRLDHVKRDFSSAQAPYFDDRGHYFLKYGEPQMRFRDPGGSKKMDFSVQQALREAYSTPPAPTYTISPNETWTYDHIASDFVVHFEERNGMYREVADLTSLVRSGRSRDGIWHWYDLVSARRNVLPGLSELFADVERWFDAFARRPDSLSAAGVLNNQDEGQGLLDLIEARTNAPTQSDVQPRRSFSSPTLQAANREHGFRPHDLVLKEKARMELRETNGREKVPPASYVPLETINRLPFSYDVAQFRGNKGAVKLEVVFYARAADVLSKSNAHPQPDSLQVEYACLLRDRRFEPLVEVRVPSYLTAGFAAEYLFEKLVLMGPAGSGEIALQITDSEERICGFRKEPIILRDFSNDSLMISDLLFLTEVPNQGGSEFQYEMAIRDQIMTPYPFPEVRKSTPLFCYFEIYNLTAFAGRVDFDIELTVCEAEELQNLMGKIANVFSSSEQPLLSIRNKQAIQQESSQELVSLDLSNLPAGSYYLDITVSDPSGGVLRAFCQKRFTLKD